MSYSSVNYWQSDWSSIILLIVILLAIILIIYGEYVAHDCIGHKKCTHSAERPSPSDDNAEYIRKLQGMVRNNNDYVIWRRALLAALIAVIPIVYYLRGRFPTWIEVFVVVLIVFVVTYFVMTWMHAHYFSPNTNRIVDDLQKLSDQLNLSDK